MATALVRLIPRYELEALARLQKEKPDQTHWPWRGRTGTNDVGRLIQDALEYESGLPTCPSCRTEFFEALQPCLDYYRHFLDNPPDPDANL